MSLLNLLQKTIYHLHTIEDNLASHFSTKVKMVHNKKGYGSITLEYYSLQELNKILDQMNVVVS